MQLSKSLRIYRVPKNDWDDKWEDDAYDLAVIDEYRGWKSIDWINMFAEGSPMNLLRRGCSDVAKLQKIPMVICSNCTIFEAYQQLSHPAIHLIEARFLQVEIPDDGLIRIEFEGVDVNDL